MNPIYHSESSAKKWGGKDIYLEDVTFKFEN